MKSILWRLLIPLFIPREAKSWSLTLLALLALLPGFTQDISLKGTIYDEHSKNKVAYATVQILSTKNTRDANEYGYFEIVASKADTLAISCIGYQQLLMPVMAIHPGDSFLLKKRFNELEPVVVSNPVIYQIGIIQATQTRSHIGTPEDRYEMATLMEVPANVKQYRITKIFIHQHQFNEAAPYRLHIYAVDQFGLPGKELLQQEVVAGKADHSNSLVEKDISEQNIVLSGTSFFAGIQWLHFPEAMKGKKNDQGIAETSKEKKPLTYRRSMRLTNDRWYIEYEGALYFPATGTAPEAGNRPTKKNPVNMLVYAEIEAIGK